MPITNFLYVFLLFFAVTQSLYAEKLELSSSTQQTTLLKLYTSEGCSSCPSADLWLSKLKNDARLWQQIVPIAFHVDYWNYLGWKDRFSNKKHSQRQNNYKQHGNIESVYTPGLVYNGREWRSWFKRRTLPTSMPDNAGILKAVIEGNSFSAEFMPVRPQPSSLMLNIALLAFDQTNNISAGENSGKILNHDFVVINWQQYSQTSDKHHHWSLDGLPTRFPVNATGIALWVTSANDPTPLQAVGGYLK